MISPSYWNFATALLIGALLGIERERHKREHDELTIGGLRTFILFTLIGALGGWLTMVLGSPWILAAALVVAVAPVLAGYVLSARAQPDSLGLTTELAAIAACLLGAMTTLGYRELAVGLGVTVAALLAYKQPLHGIVKNLDREDVYAGLRLMIATFIVLPLLPDRAIDPLGALNPRSLWVLVLLISSLSLVGYVATRLLGTQRGIPLTGLTGGLVSSTAVTLAFSKQSRDPAYASAAPALASGILLAWTVMFVRVLVMVLVVNRDLLPALATPLATMAVVALAVAWYLRRRGGTPQSTEGIPLTNPIQPDRGSKVRRVLRARAAGCETRADVCAGPRRVPRGRARRHDGRRRDHAVDGAVCADWRGRRSRARRSSSPRSPTRSSRPPWPACSAAPNSGSRC